MEDFIEVTSVMTIMLILLLLRKRRIVRRYWIRPLLTLRAQYGHFNLYNFMRNEAEEDFFRHTRLTTEQFDLVRHLIGDLLDKHSIRTPLSTEFRLYFTLRCVNYSNVVNYNIVVRKVVILLRNLVNLIW